MVIVFVKCFSVSVFWNKTN